MSSINFDHTSSYILILQPAYPHQDHEARLPQASWPLLMRMT